MHNHYRTLGLTNAASTAEIRRAYRILARRYHPDVNPNGDTEELFKQIALAYSVLSDLEKKQQYDLDLKQSSESFQETFERAQDALKRNQQAKAYAGNKRPTSAKNANQPKAAQEKKKESELKAPTTQSSKYLALTKKIKPVFFSLSTKLGSLPQILNRLERAAKTAGHRSKQSQPGESSTVINQVAILELSISMVDAISGVKKSVDISSTANASRKVSVTIPPGVQTGSIVRFRSKERENEEIVIVIRIENHPWLSLGERGLTMEVPLTVGEAIDGGKVQVPSFGDPLLVTVEPGTQSGREVRLKGQGLTRRDGTRGDLYIRFVVKIPDSRLPTEVRSVTEMLAESYSRGVRAHLPKGILE
jgi:DnaJ-class molecular chaperone